MARSDVFFSALINFKEINNMHQSHLFLRPLKEQSCNGKHVGSWKNTDILLIHKCVVFKKQFWLGTMGSTSTAVKTLYNVFCSSRSDVTCQLGPKATSLNNQANLGVWSYKEVSLPDFCRPDWTVAASCIVCNLVTSYEKENYDISGSANMSKYSSN